MLLFENYIFKYTQSFSDTIFVIYTNLYNAFNIKACRVSLLSDTQPLSLYISTQDGYEKEQQTQTDAIWDP